MISNVPSLSSISRNTTNRSITHPTPPSSSPLQPERKGCHRLRLFIYVYSLGSVKFGHNKFAVYT